MDEYFSVSNLKSLQELLSPANNDSDSEDEIQDKTSKKLVPSDIGSANNLPESSSSNLTPNDNDSNIWSPSEITTAQSPELVDPRQVPEYEIKFKQAVSTEDIYLGIGFKTPASASCEWLSIYIKLPGEERENIELNVESECVDIRSPRYRLHLPTSHPVDPNASTAKWHSDSSTLELTLKMTRELDAVNF